MHITCNEDGFNFRFSFPDLKSRPSLSFLKLRFDDMPIETYSILPLLNFISLGFSTNEKGHGIVTNDADLLTRRLPGHKRLRVSLIAKNPSRRVVEEFDISEVTAETLNFMLETECTQNPDPRVLTPEEAQALVDEIGIARSRVRSPFDLLNLESVSVFHAEIVLMFPYFLSFPSPYLYEKPQPIRRVRLVVTKVSP